MKGPATEEKENQRAVQSVEVGGQLLLALANSEVALPLKELAARAGLTASRAHPYLVSFQRLGLVEQELQSGLYALGPSALQMGLTALHQLDPLKVALPVAERLAQETGHAVALAVWGNFGPTIVRLFEARQPLHVLLRVGSVMSVFGTATGRAFAGSMAPERLQRADMAPVGEPAGKSRASKLPLAEAASAQEEIALHGVTRAMGRPIPGVNAFSAPAHDHDGSAAIVITVIDHAERMGHEWSDPAVAAVRQAAETITRKLGGPVRSQPAPTPGRMTRVRR